MVSTRNPIFPLDLGFKNINASFEQIKTLNVFKLISFEGSATVYSFKVLPDYNQAAQNKKKKKNPQSFSQQHFPLLSVRLTLDNTGNGSPDLVGELPDLSPLPLLLTEYPQPALSP
jgi:hypothetical protein